MKIKKGDVVFSKSHFDWGAGIILGECMPGTYFVKFEHQPEWSQNKVMQVNEGKLILESEINEARKKSTEIL